MTVQFTLVCADAVLKPVASMWWCHYGRGRFWEKPLGLGYSFKSVDFHVIWYCHWLTACISSAILASWGVGKCIWRKPAVNLPLHLPPLFSLFSSGSSYLFWFMATVHGGWWFSIRKTHIWKCVGFFSMVTVFLMQVAHSYDGHFFFSIEYEVKLYFKSLLVSH